MKDNSSRKQSICLPLEADFLINPLISELFKTRISNAPPELLTELPENLFQRHKVIKRRISEIWAEDLQEPLIYFLPLRIKQAILAMNGRLKAWSIVYGIEQTSPKTSLLNEAEHKVMAEIMNKKLFIENINLAISSQTQAAFQYRSKAGVDRYYCAYIEATVKKRAPLMVRTVFLKSGWREMFSNALKNHVEQAGFTLSEVKSYGSERKLTYPQKSLFIF